MNLTRRRFVASLAGGGAALAVGGCSRGTASEAVTSGSTPSARPSNPPTRQVSSFVLNARPATVDLGGTVVDTWAFGDTIPGTPLRATAGDRVQVAFSNALPLPTSVHWHGLAIRNDMDGVPGVTTPETPAGGSFAFDFVVPDAGTHWFHPHHGLQMDRGLYAPFIVDDPDEPGDYEAEWILTLDDWTDGVGPSPDELLADLRSAGDAGGASGMGGMMGGGSGGMGMMGGDGGDVPYPLFLVNGRTVTDPDALAARPGDRVRLRIINAAADTIFAVALDDHDLTITHTDGYPVEPARTSSVLIGMGERYDAIVTLKDGAFALVAEPLGKEGMARALVRTGAGAVPPENRRPDGLAGSPLTVADLSAGPGTALPAREPDSLQDVLLSGSMSPYVWTINGATYDQAVPLTITEGQLGRLRIFNHSMMSHPLHIHGHTFQLGSAGGKGPRKDTVLIPPMGGVSADLVADNPGDWMVHCHNAYHAEAGMMTRLDYELGAR